MEVSIWVNKSLSMLVQRVSISKTIPFLGLTVTFGFFSILFSNKNSAPTPPPPSIFNSSNTVLKLTKTQHWPSFSPFLWLFWKCLKMCYPLPFWLGLVLLFTSSVCSSLGFFSNFLMKNPSSETFGKAVCFCSQFFIELQTFIILTHCFSLKFTVCSIFFLILEAGGREEGCLRLIVLDGQCIWCHASAYQLLFQKASFSSKSSGTIFRVLFWSCYDSFSKCEF